jgi:hypothetical protein
MRLDGGMIAACWFLGPSLRPRPMGARMVGSAEGAVEGLAGGPTDLAACLPGLAPEDVPLAEALLGSGLPGADL